MNLPLETFAECSILFKFKEGENFNHRNILDISEGRGSRVRVALNEVRAVFHRPHSKRVTNKGAVKSVRRFLQEAGVKV